MEALSRREENELLANAKQFAMKECDDLVKIFADCATGRIFSLPFVCRGKLKEMQACMRQHLTDDKMDAMKLEYISNRSENGRKAVEALKRSRLEKLGGQRAVQAAEMAEAERLKAEGKRI